jgi:hypothetical protein
MVGMSVTASYQSVPCLVRSYSLFSPGKKALQVSLFFQKKSFWNLKQVKFEIFAKVLFWNTRMHQVKVWALVRICLGKSVTVETTISTMNNSLFSFLWKRVDFQLKNELAEDPQHLPNVCTCALEPQCLTIS